MAFSDRFEFFRKEKRGWTGINSCSILIEFEEIYIMNIDDQYIKTDLLLKVLLIIILVEYRSTGTRVVY